MIDDDTGSPCTTGSEGEQLSRLMRHGSSPQWVNMSHSPHFTLQTLLRFIFHQVKHPLAPAHCQLNNVARLLA